MVLYFGREKLKDLGPVMPGSCNACGHETWAHLLKRRRWLTLFSLPLIPLSAPSYDVYCEKCLATQPVDEADVDATKEQLRHTERLAKGEESWDDYADRLEDFSASVGDDVAHVPPDDREDPRGYA